MEYDDIRSKIRSKQKAYFLIGVLLLLLEICIGIIVYQVRDSDFLFPTTDYIDMSTPKESNALGIIVISIPIVLIRYYCIYVWKSSRLL